MTNSLAPTNTDADKAIESVKALAFSKLQAKTDEMIVRYTIVHKETGEVRHFALRAASLDKIRDSIIKAGFFFRHAIVTNHRKMLSA